MCQLSPTYKSHITVNIFYKLLQISAHINGDTLEFTYLRDLLELSDGNLSVQIRKLEEAGYIKVKKVFVDRKPKTFCKISRKGQRAVKNLIGKLEALVNLD